MGVGGVRKQMYDNAAIFSKSDIIFYYDDTSFAEIKLVHFHTYMVGSAQLPSGLRRRNI